MTEFSVDQLSSSDLNTDTSIGQALARLEGDVAAGFELDAFLRELSAGASVDSRAAEQRLAEWRHRVHTTLVAVFRSKAAALGFSTSRSFDEYSPRIVGLQKSFSASAQALLAIRQDQLRRREQIAHATQDLCVQAAHRVELLSIVQDARSMTEELWLKIIADPIVAPPAIRLTDLGIAQNALWDIIKFGLGVAATRVSNP